MSSREKLKLAKRKITEATNLLLEVYDATEDTELKAQLHYCEDRNDVASDEIKHAISLLK